MACTAQSAVLVSSNDSNLLCFTIVEIKGSNRAVQNLLCVCVLCMPASVYPHPLLHTEYHNAHSTKQSKRHFGSSLKTLRHGF